MDTTSLPTSPPTSAPSTEAPTPALVVPDDDTNFSIDFVPDDDTNFSIDFVPDDDTNTSIDFVPDDDTNFSIDFTPGVDDTVDDGDFRDQPDGGGLIPGFQEPEEDPVVEITNEDFVSRTNGD
jgi:hypothetical protein